MIFTKIIRGFIRAGQAIGDNVFNYCRVPPSKVQRALISDNHPRSIEKALKNLRPNTDFFNLYQEELARAVSDQRLGYNFTRLMTCQARKQGYNQKLNCGRVQSAILGLVVRRTRQREGHTATKYYNITGYFDFAAGTLKGRFIHRDHALLEVDEQERLNNAGQAKLVAQRTNGRPATLITYEKKNTHDSAPLPYDLLSLQVDCSRYYGMSPDDVLRITQELRDAPFHAITYNRSDNRYIDESNFPDAPNIIENLNNFGVFGPLIQRTDSTIKSRAFNSKKVGAHGAICPTETASGWDEMSDEQKAVFILISRNYLLQFMSKRERLVANYVVEVKCDKGTVHHFQGRIQKVLTPGWSSVFRNDEGAEDVMLEDVNDIDIDAFHCEEKSHNSAVEVTEQTTTPPALYTMTTLLSDLKATAKYIEDEKVRTWMLEKDREKEGEHGGIGTAATRSTILKELFENQLLQKDSKSKVIPTNKGGMLFDILPRSITSPDTTAIWSHYFRQIGDGESTPEMFWSEVNQFIESVVTTTKAKGLSIPQHLIATPPNDGQPDRGAAPQALTEKCPKCGKTASYKKGKFGPYWQCGDCRSNFNDKAGTLFYEQCPRCKHDLKIVKGKKVKKPFIGCSNHPQCSYTAQME